MYILIQLHSSPPTVQDRYLYYKQEYQYLLLSHGHHDFFYMQQSPRRPSIPFHIEAFHHCWEGRGYSGQWRIGLCDGKDQLPLLLNQLGGGTEVKGASLQLLPWEGPVRVMEGDSQGRSLQLLSSSVGWILAGTLGTTQI